MTNFNYVPSILTVKSSTTLDVSDDLTAISGKTIAELLDDPTEEKDTTQNPQDTQDPQKDQI
jgi:hypothetical protein